MTLQKFELKNKIAIITGGGGLLGTMHAEAIAEAGGIPLLWDIYPEAATKKAKEIAKLYKINAAAFQIDITNEAEIKNVVLQILKNYGTIDILINNAANNPKMENNADVPWSRLENFPLEQWQADINVGLTGAFLCSKVIGQEMQKRKKGVIVNIASDLAVIAPDQRIYKKENTSPEKQPVKPVTYSVVKSGLVGLTKYLATYWAEDGIRVNAISPGGVFNNQPEDFVKKLTNLIPMERMAKKDEYKGAIVFLCSDASSYMTGQNLIVDGGRTCW